MIEITIHGTPPAKNARHRIVLNRKTGAPRRINTMRFSELVDALNLSRLRARFDMINKGTWHLDVTCYWPTLRHLDVDVPHADHDAALSCISDALQKAGVIDDDARIISSSTLKSHDKENPRTIIRLTKL